MNEQGLKTEVIDVKSLIKKSANLLKNKKVQIGLTILILTIILLFSTIMRLSNLPLLIDKTTGNYTLSDPDALYWLRLESNLLQSGNLNGIDVMRYPSLNITYTQELLPYIVVDVYKIIHSIYPPVTYQFIDAIYPAYAFAISLVIFFFLIYVLTKSKVAALIASAFLAFSPAYMFRTIAGVSGHEALGILFLFVVFLVFILGLKKFHKNWKQTIIWGVIVGFFTTLSFAAWGGTINFIFLIFPLTLLWYYLFNIEEDNIKLKQKFFAFYLIWIVTSLLATYLVHFNPFKISSLLVSTAGILVPFVLLVILIDSIIFHYKIVKKQKLRFLISVIASIFIGILGLEVVKGGGFSLIGRIYGLLIHPIGATRIGQTVAYYAQPYLDSFKSQISDPFFYIFLLGTSLVCIEMIKKVKTAKHRIIFGILWVISVIGILFSRYSSGSVLNGVNFLSQLIYFLGFLTLISSLVWIYYKDRHKIDETVIFIFSWMIVMLITVRAAQRTIFIIIPFIALVGAYFIVKTAEQTKKLKGKDIRYVLGALFILSLILSFAYLFGNPFAQSAGAIATTQAQAQQTGPLMNDQWQNAMAWVRTNTPTNSVFIHWWDYGYLLQTIGLRTTVLDGGNFNSFWDHLMGRYVLTTPNPNTALSFMKSHGVSYLLIDFTDLGKYSAYSTIGSDNSGIDRFSSPNTLLSDPSQDRQSQGKTIRVYQGSTFVDQDISYNNVFLPGPSSKDGKVSGYYSYFIGITMPYDNSNSSISFSQPSAVFQYNGQQYFFPIRYVYYKNKLIDYGIGIDSTFMIVPSISVQNGKVGIDQIGGGIYLSPKVQQSLYARLYLMDDYYKQYPTLTKGDFEENSIVNMLNSQGANIGEFAIYQGQLLAPLKIWKVDYASNIVSHDEFLRTSGEYAEFDNLTFIT